MILTLCLPARKDSHQSPALAPGNEDCTFLEFDKVEDGQILVFLKATILISTEYLATK